MVRILSVVVEFWVFRLPRGVCIIVASDVYPGPVASIMLTLSCPVDLSLDARYPIPIGVKSEIRV